jgi:hypothetical protein
MNLLRCSVALALCWLPGFAQTAADANSRLLLRADLECKLIIDGKPGGALAAGDGISVSLPLGEHQVEAVAPNGARWRETVNLTQPEGQALAIPLRDTVARAEAVSRGYWTDPETHLTWATADNGSGVTLNQAAYYCRFLTLGGHNDWTLASIDDLQHLFGGPADRFGHHLTGPIKLTGWVWSSSPGKEPGEQWALDFGDGGRASVVNGDSGLNRALCVRRGEE